MVSSSRALALIAALCLVALAPPAMAGDRSFTIGGEAFAEADILDARALPSMDGMPTVLVSFSEAAAERFTKIAQAYQGKPVAIVLDGKTLSSPLVNGPIETSAIEISGLASLVDAVRLARLISGKEPLRDELEE